MPLLSIGPCFPARCARSEVMNAGLATDRLPLCFFCGLAWYRTNHSLKRELARMLGVWFFYESMFAAIKHSLRSLPPSPLSQAKGQAACATCEAGAGRTGAA